jgi:hypothetical protein
MWPRSGHAVPAGTAQVARAAFPKRCLAIRIRDALGELFEDAQFAGLFATRGRPAVSPARLALVLVLSEFRARLLGDDQAERLLGRMLERLRAQGLLVRGGRQRNRLELLTETPRAALEALAAAAPEWLLAMVPEDWCQRYGQRAGDYRRPQAKAARAALAVTVGADGFALLEAVHAADAPSWLRQVPAVRTLRAVGIQRYYRDGQGLRRRGKGELPPAALAIDSPHDTDARYGINAAWAGAATGPTSPRPASPTGPT